MGKGSGNGTTRGDRKRNARRKRLRGLLPRDGAVIGIDLAEDKQAIAVVDHDVRVLARKTVRVKAFRLGEVLDWAVGQARGKGFARVTVACEPTGARWMQVQRLCAERGLPLVCIQPLVSHPESYALPNPFGSHRFDQYHPGPRLFQDHDVSPRMVNGRSMERPAHRVASVMSMRPARRSAPIARLRRAAMILGPDRVLTWDLSS